ncbi:hypothetical protein NW759_011482 [Fusarium solani]|nr:hypothetical protein NW759_011482 [Fusarium solani]
MAGPFGTVSWAGGDGHNIPLQQDGKNAYYLTLAWYATGTEIWLTRAKNTILAWGSTLKDLNEHIQGGEGLAYMTAAAEILRASASDSGWSSENTKTYLGMIDRISAGWNETRGLVGPNFFMNQGAYGNSGAMNVAVFSDNRDLYEDMVYHATVGANPDPSIDYAIPIQISGDKDFYGQVTEMGPRIQGTSGVDFFTQNSSRLLAGWEYWSRYNSGDDDVPWEPKATPPATSDEVYAKLNDISRGRNYANDTALHPLETIGVAYHEYYRRGDASEMPHHLAYMKWQGLGWDAFEWGDDGSLKAIGLL